MDELYADRIREVSITGSVIRIDLASLAHEKGAEGKPELVLRQRVVMSVEGFAQSFGLLVQVMQQLEKQGVVKGASAAGAFAESGQPKSSNFS